MASVESETQLDRIERKLDELLYLRDVIVKLAMPKTPAAMRPVVARLLAGRGERDVQ